MSNQSFSLFHHVAPPQAGLGSNPPLLLLLHGFGANEEDLFSLAPYLDERFLVVSARAPFVLGPMSYAWFRLGFTPEGEFFAIDPEDAERSRHLIRKFIEELVEAYHCDPNAIYLMGFSQGAMMSLAVALTFPGLAAAVVAMSGRILPHTISQIPDKDLLAGLPIFVAHGTQDTLIPINNGRDLRSRLSALPVDLTYREYQMGHAISAESLSDITAWLKDQLDRSKDTIVF
jgi:phospholipase/carboxylesterase